MFVLNLMVTLVTIAVMLAQCSSRFPILVFHIVLHLDLGSFDFGTNSSGNSSGFLKGSLVQKIRDFRAGSGSGSKDLDLLNPSESRCKTCAKWVYSNITHILHNIYTGTASL